MNDLWFGYISGVGAVIAMMVGVWLVSLRLEDASIVDVFWGPGFVLAGWTFRWLGPPAELRQLLLLALLTIWGTRLATHIWLRGRSEGEDYRYASMRESHGRSFWWVSLYSVFLLQAGLIAVIVLPHLVVQGSAVEPGWRWSDLVGLVLWIVGFAFEAGGDWQLQAFKADPKNRGEVLRSGFWAWSRHPNYFGDALQWWSFWIISLGAPWGWATVVSPIVMTGLLLKVSGVALLEKTITERRPAYRDYIESTSAFFPWIPKKPRGGG